ncbi:MAG: hypothetical protein NVS4B8_06220 [Herpetosiphon sp.]
MPIKRLLAWLSVLLILLCNIGMAWLAIRGGCRGEVRICGRRDLTADLGVMIVAGVLPLTVLLGLGLWAGLKQIRRTHGALRELLELPRVNLEPACEALVAQLQLGKRVDVVASADCEAFCYGFLLPRIYLTTGLLGRMNLQELDAVLRHEQHHLQRRDPLRTLLWTMLDNACWWLDHGGEQASLRRELAADRAVIRAGGKQPLAAALLKLITQTQLLHGVAGDLAIGGLSVTDARIDQLLQPDLTLPPAPGLFSRLALPTFITVALLLCTLFMVRL